MATSLPDREARGGGGEVARGNLRWKERWSTWVMRSTLAAVVAHAVLFALWPVWDVARRAPQEAPVEIVQIRPVATSAFLPEPEDASLYDSPTTVLPSAAELEADRAAGGGTEIDAPRLADDLGSRLAGLGGMDPSLAYPVMRSGGYARPAPPLPSDELNLDEVAILPRVARLPPTISWPLIRNPSAVVRFLRARYNSVFRPDARGSVSVAMWVNERGSVEWSEIRESSGNPVLDEIALSMFNDVVLFRPARSQGAPVPVTVVIRVPFDAPW